MKKTLNELVTTLAILNGLSGDYSDRFVDNRKVKTFKSEVKITETEKQILERYKSKRKCQRR